MAQTRSENDKRYRLYALKVEHPDFPMKATLQYQDDVVLNTPGQIRITIFLLTILLIVFGKLNLEKNTPFTATCRFSDHFFVIICFTLHACHTVSNTLISLKSSQQVCLLHQLWGGGGDRTYLSLSYSSLFYTGFFTASQL